MKMNLTVLGFVVNMFNPLNYDIDLDLPDDFPTHELEKNTYTYVEEGSGDVRRGFTYRCRLIGILRRKFVPNQDEFNASARAITQRISRMNGWILVRILGFDKYKRLLVELVDFVSGVSINVELRSNKNIYMEYS
jgi:hypothetical protein